MNTQDEARDRAAQLERWLVQHAPIFPGSPKQVFRKLRSYLLAQLDQMQTRNDSYRGLKLTTDRGGISVINLGPSIDKGPTSHHFQFDSGARLSFGVTLKSSSAGSSLVSFRFHLQLPDGRSPEFLRFDLNPEAHADPLAEPRSHLHPGLDQVRLPLPPLTPFEILDRVFFVIEPALS